MAIKFLIPREGRIFIYQPVQINIFAEAKKVLLRPDSKRGISFGIYQEYNHDFKAKNLYIGLKEHVFLHFKMSLSEVEKESSIGTQIKHTNTVDENVPISFTLFCPV